MTYGRLGDRVDRLGGTREGGLEPEALVRASPCPDHAERVVEKDPVVLVDIVFGGLPCVQQCSQRGLDPGRSERLDRQIWATRDGNPLARGTQGRGPVHPTGHLMLPRLGCGRPRR